MRLKHNKKRNTAFVYEALVRELTESVVKKNKNKQNKIVSILKDHFTKDSVLKKELDLYKTIYETRHIEKNVAEKIVFKVKEEHDSLDKRRLFQEQSALINKINRILSNKLYNNFVPNYKTIASVYSIFQETLPIKDRVLLEENIVQHMSCSIENKDQNLQQPIDSLVYKTFVSSFNEEYSKSLNENQKQLLGQYISSFMDNGVDLKIYLNEEIGSLKERLKKASDLEQIKTDLPLKSKLEKVYNILNETKSSPIDTNTLEIVLNTQDLLEELEKDDD